MHLHLHLQAMGAGHIAAVCSGKNEALVRENGADEVRCAVAVAHSGVQWCHTTGVQCSVVVQRVGVVWFAGGELHHHLPLGGGLHHHLPGPALRQHGGGGQVGGRDKKKS